MRHSSEFRRAWSDASGVAMDVGKKLLGYLANQKRLSGVDSLVQRVTLEDGTVVEARWDMNIPTVRIYPGGSEDAACELYVESGLLDLGPNIAPDANKRFNRGPPEFDDSPATLYFGDGVTCVDGEPGLNGSIHVESGAMVTQCLPSTGNGIASRVADPIKKRAQAMLPASLWSGMMQRYVQAVYGGDQLEYSGTPTALTIGTATINVSSSVGLVNIEGTLYFIVIADGMVDFRAVVPHSPCIDAVLRMWATMPEASDLQKSRKNKVLTIALSGCVIGKVLTTRTIMATGNRHFQDRAEWVFSHDAPKAVAVIEKDGTANAYELTFKAVAVGVDVDLATLASAEVMVSEEWPLIVGGKSPWQSPGAALSGLTRASGDGTLYSGDSYDFPVYAYYDDAGAPVVVKYTLLASTSAVADTSECYSPEDGNGPYLTLATLASPERKCRSSIVQTYRVAVGYYCTAWSQVSLVDCFDKPDTPGEASGKVVRSASAGFQSIASDMVPQETAPETHSELYIYDCSECYFLPCSYEYPVKFGDIRIDGCVVDTIPTRDDSRATTYSGEELGCAVTLSGNPNDGVDICNERYIFTTQSYDIYRSVTSTQPYLPVTGYVFSGKARNYIPQVISLPWGSTSQFVVEQYAMAGGDGGYASMDSRALHPSTALGASGKNITVEVTLPFIKRTADTPGDLCIPHVGDGRFTNSDGGSHTLTWTGDVVSYESDYSVSMREFVSFPHPGLIRWDDVAGTSHSERYRPMVRGVEKYAALVSPATTVTAMHDVSQDSEYTFDDYPAADYVASDPDMIGCAVGDIFGMQELSDAHIETDMADGTDVPWYSQGTDGLSWLITGFSYQGAESLLHAKITPTPMIDRGASLNMDRQTIDGGYSTVSTPSFVGWA